MKSISLVAIMLAVFGAWFSLSRQSRRVEHAAKEELIKLEEAAFMGGVRCAINVHLNYQIDALLKGSQPNPSTMENKEWEKKARAIWIMPP